MKSIIIALIALNTQFALAQKPISADSLSQPISFSLSTQLNLKPSSENTFAISLMLDTLAERPRAELFMAAGANLHNRPGCIISTENSGEDNSNISVSPSLREKNYSVRLVERQRSGTGVAHAAGKFAGISYSSHTFIDIYEITRASDNLTLKMVCSETCLEVSIRPKTPSKCEPLVNQSGIEILKLLGVEFE